MVDGIEVDQQDPRAPWVSDQIHGYSDGPTDRPHPGHEAGYWGRDTATPFVLRTRPPPCLHLPIGRRFHDGRLIRPGSLRTGASRRFHAGRAGSIRPGRHWRPWDRVDSPPEARPAVPRPWVDPPGESRRRWSDDRRIGRRGNLPASGRAVTGSGPMSDHRRHRRRRIQSTSPARPRWAIGERVDGQRPRPKPPTPRPGRTPSPDAGPPMPPGL